MKQPPATKMHPASTDRQDKAVNLREEKQAEQPKAQDQGDPKE